HRPPKLRTPFEKSHIGCKMPPRAHIKAHRFERLEPYEGKLSSTVLRGGRAGNSPPLLGRSRQKCRKWKGLRRPAGKGFAIGGVSRITGRRYSRPARSFGGCNFRRSLGEAAALVEQRTSSQANSLGDGFGADAAGPRVADVGPAFTAFQHS